jgi:hypothetical protein
MYFVIVLFPVSNIASNQNGNMKPEPDSILPAPKITLFPADDIQLGWRGTHCVGAGMINVGNTCYLNSTLQVCLQKLVVISNVCEMFIMFRIMCEIEIWGIHEGWRERDVTRVRFCKKVLGVHACTVNGVAEIERMAEEGRLWSPCLSIGAMCYAMITEVQLQIV